MATLLDARQEVLAVCEKHGVRLEVVVNDERESEHYIHDRIWIDIVYRKGGLIGSTRLYHE